MFRAIRAHATWWTHLLVGAVSLVAGLYVLAYPEISGFLLAVVIATWAVVVGVVEVLAGITRARFLPVVTGVVSILFGFVLFANPVAGALALVWVIGVFAIVRGIVVLVGALRAPAGGPAPS